MRDVDGENERLRIRPRASAVGRAASDDAVEAALDHGVPRYGSALCDRGIRSDVVPFAVTLEYAASVP